MPKKTQNRQGERGFLKELSSRPTIPTSHKTFDWKTRQDGGPKVPKTEDAGVIRKGVSGKGVKPSRKLQSDYNKAFKKK